MSLAATPTSTADHTVTRLRPTVAAYAALHYGTSPTPMVRIVPDECWPGMWRMVWPDGTQSDMANLARIKDAAAAICERGPPREIAGVFAGISKIEFRRPVLPGNATPAWTDILALQPARGQFPMPTTRPREPSQISCQLKPKMFFKRNFDA